ncbi:hypothetical protein CL176_11940 [Suicoccus acidiformans]|uniref:Lantibiotic ABC transporter permease n=1 Tax=Suicoccus acidiformans TaxID=2036206 RepID=A0A347WNJ4_9LACT|nr:hypothetical protein [Suicoccus acidiformans]AXY26651.1 hypothetical protein CL176_11940 [Suicoccus acidiformans]
MQVVSHVTRIASWTMFIIMTLINILSGLGMFFAHRPLDILALNDNYFLPAPFTHGIWILIFICFLLMTVYDLLLQGDEQVTNYYRQLVQPKLIEIYLFQILWLICLCQDILLGALIFGLIYMQRLLELVKLISGTAPLRKRPMLLKYPAGLQFSLSIVLTMMTLSVYLVNRGIAGQGRFMFWLSIILLIVMVALSAYYYVLYGNVMVVLAVIWYILGVAVRYYAKDWELFITALLLLIISTALFISLRRKQAQRQ